MAATSEAQRRIVVTRHAITQAEQRFRANGKGELVRAWIEDEVESAIAAGRCTNHKLDGFRLYGEKRRQLPGRHRFVYSDDGRHAWIVVRERESDFVVTSLFRAGVNR